jgi:hypothetical protein
VLAPNYSVSSAESSLSILQGTSGAGLVQIGAVNGFSGAVALAASGLPTGVKASFSTTAVTGVSIVTFTVPATAATGTSNVTITATSGSLSHTTTLSLTILAASAGTVPVSLSSVFNVSGLAADGVPFTGGGLDNGGRSYSGVLLGASQTIGGTLFTIGPMNAADAVSAKTVPLPAGQFSTLRMLATGVNGNQLSQSFTVNYTDGTKSTFTQSLSDWSAPQRYTGETTAVTSAYRDLSTGAQSVATYELYEYSFALTSGKTVSSVVLPNNRNVVVLAMTLTH